MASANAIAEIAALIGDAARTNMLSALMGGQALTAGELAGHASVTAQTASGHLAKMLAAGLLALEKQGRHRYYRLASPEIAQALQALMVVAASSPRRHHPIGPRDQALRLARTCYDHLAGRLAIAITDSLYAGGHVVLNDGAALITASGTRFFAEFGIELGTDTSSRRALCRTCLDWSERRPHLAGRLGAGLLLRLLELGWITRIAGTRALEISRAGTIGLSTAFHLPDGWQIPPSP
ncbi:helix-turn-helix transcriptional regulator [Magnetospirillum sp. J10]|uniref:Helix-turn-helix transcriptional regulator n=1 Tax=Magnetospirillum sulfuroxidans TaxID=611300 RepID=A0ABS5IFP0_9PROT|nr:helix-turn-helix transcriptional regulator [Magnetospirillum sulfuroxidans]